MRSWLFRNRREVQVGQEVNAHLNLRVAQGLIGGIGIGGHVEFDEIALVDGQNVHEVHIAPDFAGNEQLGAVAGFTVGDSDFVHI